MLVSILVEPATSISIISLAAAHRLQPLGREVFGEITPHVTLVPLTGRVADQPCIVCFTYPVGAGGIAGVWEGMLGNRGP